MKKRLLWVVGLIAWIAAATALAEKKYDPGATDTELNNHQLKPVGLS